MHLLNSFTIILPLISLIIFGNFQFDHVNAQEPLNRWPNACHKDLTISGLTVNKNGNENCTWRFVFAEKNILDSAHHILDNSADDESSRIFYFEISVKNLKSLFQFGIAIKHEKQLDDSIKGLEGTYAYANNGYFWHNGSSVNVKEKFVVGDTVGCGVNLENKKLFFTKNGKQIFFTKYGKRKGTIDLPNFSSDHSADQFGQQKGSFELSTSAGQLFPFVSLLCKNDEIEANFGFMFDLATLKTE